MLALALSMLAGAAAWNPQAPLSRREVMAIGLAGSATLAPSVAHAQRSALIPKSNAESTASFKAYQLSEQKSRPGEESEAFKNAEKLRAARAAGPGTAKAASTQDDLSRLGLKTYGEAVAGGFDECATWRGCRNKP